jgi:hypothetical protein
LVQRSVSKVLHKLVNRINWMLATEGEEGKLGNKLRELGHVTERTTPTVGCAELANDLTEFGLCAKEWRNSVVSAQFSHFSLRQSFSTLGHPFELIRSNRLLFLTSCCIAIKQRFEHTLVASQQDTHKI